MIAIPVVTIVIGAGISLLLGLGFFFRRPIATFVVSSLPRFAVLCLISGITTTMVAILPKIAEENVKAAKEKQAHRIEVLQTIDPRWNPIINAMLCESISCDGKWQIVKDVFTNTSSAYVGWSLPEMVEQLSPFPKLTITQYKVMESLVRNACYGFDYNYRDAMLNTISKHIDLTGNPVDTINGLNAKGTP